MKAILFSLSLLLLTCCHDAPSRSQSQEPAAIVEEATPPPPPVRTKKIIAKFDPVVRGPFGQYAVTAYYLVASDGTRVEVSMGGYATTHLGDSVYTNQWE